MRIDLHTHSRASDGTQTPTELIRAAHAAGLDVVAITDHDTTEGWAEAAKAAEEVGIGLVRGIEISTKMAGQSVHLLAYLPDPTYTPLLEALQKAATRGSPRSWPGWTTWACPSTSTTYAGWPARPRPSVGRTSRTR